MHVTITKDVTAQVSGYDLTYDIADDYSLSDADSEACAAVVVRDGVPQLVLIPADADAPIVTADITALSRAMLDLALASKGAPAAPSKVESA